MSKTKPHKINEPRIPSHSEPLDPFGKAQLIWTLFVAGAVLFVAVIQKVIEPGS